MENNENLFKGKLVRLGAADPSQKAAAYAHWNQNSTYHRLLDNEAARMWSKKKLQEWIEKGNERWDPLETFFNIFSLEEASGDGLKDGLKDGSKNGSEAGQGGERLIGFTGLFDQGWSHGDALVLIALGEPEYWGKGYGTEAMRLLQRYSFTELNLHRLSLMVYGYNPRAIRSYEKAGFIMEGSQRQMLNRDGQMWDIHWMGILRRDWEANQP